MRSPLLAALVALVSLGSLIPTAARAQFDTTEARADVVSMSVLWRRQGNEWNDKATGTTAVAVGDMNRDGLADFAIGRRDTVDFFLGGRPAPSMTPIASLSALTLLFDERAAVGDFWGSGHDAIAGYYRASSLEYPDIAIHRTDTAWPGPVAAARIPAQSAPGVLEKFNSVRATDIDLDGYPDLIVLSKARWRGTTLENTMELRFYRGGPGFSVERPTAVLRDVEAHTAGVPDQLVVDDIDGDQRPDVLWLMEFAPHIRRLKIWFGTGSFPSGEVLPDRTIDGFGDKFFRLESGDADGDDIADLLSTRSLFLSGRGKSARHRTFLDDDVDFRLIGESGASAFLGPLNDSSGRFDMVGSITLGVLHAFSGSPAGPDRFYEGTYTEGDHRPWYLWISPLGDVNGDGWSDVLFASYHYPVPEFQWGVALILAGGPQIPRDFIPSLVPLAPQSELASVWPVPCSDFLHVQLPDSLTNRATSVQIWSIEGRLVSSAIGTVDEARTLRVDVSAITPGPFVLVVLDRNHARLASRVLLKLE